MIKLIYMITPILNPINQLNAENHSLSRHIGSSDIFLAIQISVSCCQLLHIQKSRVANLPLRL